MLVVLLLLLLQLLRPGASPFHMLCWDARGGVKEALLKVALALGTKHGQPRLAAVGQPRPLTCCIVCYIHLVNLSPSGASG